MLLVKKVGDHGPWKHFASAFPIFCCAFLSFVSISQAASEIAVRGTNGGNIVDGDATPSQTDGTHFGRTNAVGGYKDHVFTITNSGNTALTISSFTTGGVAAVDFILVSAPAASIPAYSSSTFTLRFAPTNSGTRNATVSMANNDFTENPFNFSVRGIGIAPEVGLLGTNMASISDGDTTPTPVDGTQFETNRVYVGYVDHIFTITNSGNWLLNISGVTTNGTHPSDFIIIDGPTAQMGTNTKTTFTLRFDPSALGLRSAIVHIANDDLNEGDYDFTVQGMGVEPEIAVLGTNKALIASGNVTPLVSDGTDFGSNRVFGGTATRIFTITNSGTADLNITGVSTTGADAADFAMTAAPAASILPGQTTTFTIRFDPSVLGMRTAVIHVNNDDYDEADYTFTIQGTGVEP
ncbi:MAG: choice-of-anchor D domain-containing protein, partial [Lentisphaerota bacterium]